MGIVVAVGKTCRDYLLGFDSFCLSVRVYGASESQVTSISIIFILIPHQYFDRDYLILYCNSSSSYRVARKRDCKLGSE